MAITIAKNQLSFSIFIRLGEAKKCADVWNEKIVLSAESTLWLLWAFNSDKTEMKLW